MAKAKCIFCGGIVDIDDAFQEFACPICSEVGKADKAIERYQAISEESFKEKMNTKYIGDFSILDDKLLKYTGMESEVEIPAGVKIIGKEAFMDNVYVESVVLPLGAVEIEEKAFYNCESLSNILLPNSLRVIRHSVFGECKKLRKIVLPANIRTIERECFQNCESLVSAKLPKEITLIDWDMFENCYSLESIEVPENVTKINWDAFKNCRSLTSISIPANVQEIGAGAFAGCSKLQSIVVEKRKNKLVINRNAFADTPAHDEWERMGVCQLCGSDKNIFGKCKYCVEGFD
ncbi:MAG: leucine-rich repeat domain-containing protein [Clostridiales bacterium]|nr:leucine-rich repeat domain-containing protein [Clostridiales bacterium]